MANNGDTASYKKSFYIIRNNIIANNYSPYAGGAIYVLSTRAKIMNNHIINNSTFGGNPVIHALSGIPDCPTELDIQNNIFYGNSKSISAIQIDTFIFKYNWLEALPQQIYMASIMVVDTANNLAGTNPFMIAPTLSSLLADDATIADFSLQSNSPCINAGNIDTLNCYVSTLDYANNNRLVGYVDIGAFEQRMAQAINNSCSVNLSLKIYPNPAQQNVHVTLPNMQGELSLYDIMGKKLLFLNNIHTTEVNITLPIIPSGLYFIVWEKNDEQVVDKFWVE